MGKQFGDLAFIRGIIYYSLSPHEMKPFVGVIKHGIPNIITRTRPRIWTWLPIFAIACFTYSSVEAAYKFKLRKNPADFVNEVDPNAS